MLIRFTFITLILLLLCSCEEVVDLDVEFDPGIVVVSEVAPGRPVRVSLSRSKPILSQSLTEYVTASKVSILNRSNGQVNELFLQDPTKDTLNPSTNLFPYYSSGEAIISESNSYGLDVQIAGEAPISAITTIPKQVNIQSLRLNNFSQNSDPRNDDQYLINFNVNFIHNARTAKSYHLVFYFVYTVEELTESGNDLFDYIQVPAVDNVLMDIPYTFDFENGILIDGEDLPEGNHRLEAALSVEFSRALTTITPELYVELRNTNSDYNNYHFNLSRQRSQRDSILSQAILVPSNINNGQGIFSGYNPDVQFVRLTE